MAKQSTSKLISVLEDGVNYQPNAILAAIAELKNRNVSAFDIDAAIDIANDKAKARALKSEIPMSSWESLVWLLFPILTISPLGIWKFNQYSQNGYDKRARQILEYAIIGFTSYLILILVGIALLR